MTPDPQAFNANLHAFDNPAFLAALEAELKLYASEELAAAYERIAELEKALQPFARMADEAEDMTQIMSTVGAAFHPTMKHLVNLCIEARTALNEQVIA